MSSPSAPAPILTSAQGTASDFRNLALYAFAGVAWELICQLLENAVLGEAANGDLTRQLVHWGLTTLGWVVIAVLLIRLARRRYGYDPMAARGRPSGQGWAGIGALVVFCAAAYALAAGDGFKPVAEHAALADDFAGSAWLALAAQFLYYLAEVALVTLIVAFGQRSGELAYKRALVPWGGLLLAATWGVVHIALQGPLTGLYAIVVSLAFGGMFVLARCNVRLAYVLIAVAFIA